MSEEDGGGKRAAFRQVLRATLKREGGRKKEKEGNKKPEKEEEKDWEPCDLCWKEASSREAHAHIQICASYTAPLSSLGTFARLMRLSKECVVGWPCACYDRTYLAKRCVFASIN